MNYFAKIRKNYYTEIRREKYTFGRNRIRPTIEGGVSAISSFNRSYNFRTSTFGHLPRESYLVSDERFFLFYPGFFGAVGLEFMLNNEQAVFVNIGTSSVVQRVNDLLFLPHLKVGFTF